MGIGTSCSSLDWRQAYAVQDDLSAWTADHRVLCLSARIAGTRFCGEVST